MLRGFCMTCQCGSDMHDTPYLYDDAVIWFINIIRVMRLFASDCLDLGQISDLMPPSRKNAGAQMLTSPSRLCLKKISKLQRNGVIAP